MFFSVKKEIKIAGKLYIPCVCYTLTKTLELTVKKLADEGKARLHEHEVFFQNGKILPTAEERAEKEREEKRLERKAKKEAKLREEQEAEEADIESF